MEERFTEEVTFGLGIEVCICRWEVMGLLSTRNSRRIAACVHAGRLPRVNTYIMFLNKLGSG